MKVTKFIKILENSELNLFHPKKILIKEYEDQKIIESRIEFSFIFRIKFYKLFKIEKFYWILGECLNGYSAYSSSNRYCNVIPYTLSFFKGTIVDKTRFYLDKRESSLRYLIQEQLMERMSNSSTLSQTVKYFLDTHMKNLKEEKIIYKRD